MDIETIRKARERVREDGEIRFKEYREQIEEDFADPAERAVVTAVMTMRFRNWLDEISREN